MPEDLDPEGIDRNELAGVLTDEALRLYDEREAELGEELMRALERYLLLQIIDQRWREHLYDMDYLREGIHLRGFAQIDPLVAYKNEAFTLFSDLMNTIWSDFARMIFNIEVTIEGENGQGGAGSTQRRRRAWRSRQPDLRRRRLTYSGGGPDQPSALAAAAAGQLPAGYAADDAEDELEYEALPVVEQRVVDEHDKIGRNDPCWCGSGKKYKKCHGANA